MAIMVSALDSTMDLSATTILEIEWRLLEHIFRGARDSNLELEPCDKLPLSRWTKRGSSIDVTKASGGLAVRGCLRR